IAVLATDDLVRNALALFGHFFEATTDEALGRVDRALGVRHGLSLGDRADEHLVLIVPADDRRRDAVALLVHDHLGLLALHDRDHRIGGAQVDADDLAHESGVPSVRRVSLIRPGSRPKLTTSFRRSTRSVREMLPRAAPRSGLKRSGDRW